MWSVPFSCQRPWYLSFTLVTNGSSARFDIFSATKVGVNRSKTGVSARRNEMLVRVPLVLRRGCSSQHIPSRPPQRLSRRDPLRQTRAKFAVITQERHIYPLAP